MDFTRTRIRGVIFDMDGVLCDSEPFICEAATQMFAESYNCRVKPADFQPFVGTGEDRYLSGVAEKYSVKLQLARDKKRTYQIYLTNIKGRMRPLAGAIELLDALRAHNIKTALATSADKVKVDGNLAQIKIPSSRFNTLVCGSDVANKKPAPDIFLTAALRMGVPINYCLVVEDAPNGVQAAKAAGATCLALTTSFTADALRTVGADVLAPDLARIPVEAWR